MTDDKVGTDNPSFETINEEKSDIGSTSIENLSNEKSGIGSPSFENPSNEKSGIGNPSFENMSNKEVSIGNSSFENLSDEKVDINISSMEKLNEGKVGIGNPSHKNEKDFVVIPLESKWPKNTITYSWYKVNVFALPEKGAFKGKHHLQEEKQILKDVTGICRPGELVAIMGASGAGKTTLLNVLTKKSGGSLRVQGDLFVNGGKMSLNEFTKQSAYVQQEDLFIGTMKVKEQLVFQANLRMDRHIPYEQRMKRVEEVMMQMSLSECRNTLIGIPGRIKGISGGETKRLAFACEVLTDPPLLMCDEPTTGLDSFMAQTIVSSMRDLSSTGKTIISTIHQPSSEVFTLFDRVLLLAEGRLAFLGSTVDALKFFSGMGKTCPFNYNPADFFISTLAIRPGEEEESQVFTSEVCDKFAQSEEMRAIQEATKNNMGLLDNNVEEDDQKKRKRARRSPYKAKRFQQFKALLTRVFLELAREPMLLRIQIIQSIMVALIVGLIYLDTSGEYGQSSAQNINGVLFIFLSNISFSGTFAVVNTFCAQIPIFLREHLNGMYRCDMFFITKNIAELPMAIFMPFLFTAICYFLVNLNRSASSFFTIIAVMILSGNVGYSFGYLISCLAPNLPMALNIAAPLLIPFMIFGGYFLNPETIPPYFIWLRYISWFNYGFEALAIAQWKNVDFINCTTNLNLTCVPTGIGVITNLGYDPDNLGFDFGLLFVLLIAYRFLAYLFLLRRAYVGV